MKTKTFSVILILLFIAGVHILAVRFFIPSSKKNPPPKTEQTTVDNKTSPVEKPEKKTIPEKKIKQKKTGPFTYRKAVMGNIKSLPGTKKARSGILVNLDTREVLWAKKPREGVPIASMTKMMTLLLAIEAEKKRDDITMKSPVKVSVSAYKIGGSQVYLDPRETFTLEALLKTVAIKSANDSAQLVAEYIGNGNVYSFIADMNRKAKSMHLPGTKFYNSHGLPGKTPAEDNISSPEGLALLAEELLKYPKIVEWASTWIYKFRADTKKPMILRNHNRLVKHCHGVDGMKTGYIRRSGFCTTVTCKRGKTRLVAVATGFKSWRERDNFIRKLLDWGFRKTAMNK